MYTFNEVILIIKHKCLKIHLYLMNLIRKDNPISVVPPETEIRTGTRFFKD
jgi:hypothetical protein